MERERIEVSEGSVRENRGTHLAWIGWLGIIAGIVSFVYSTYMLASIAILLGIVSLFSRAVGLGWTAIILGIIAMAARWFYGV